MEQNIIKFVGSNSQLFTRVDVENFKSTLIVPETHTAILIKDGQMLQTLKSGKYQIADFLEKDVDSGCLLEVLFMSKTAKLKLLWGTAQKLVFFDEFAGQNYHVGFSGDFEVQIGDPRKCYLYLIGVSENLTADALQERLQSNVVSATELTLLDYIKEHHVPYTQLANNKKDMSQKVLLNLSHNLQSEYGISVFSFNILNIIIDSEDLKRLQQGGGAPEQKFCAGCGGMLGESDKFCPACGRKVEKSNICPVCKTENAENAKFCSACGAKL